MMDFKEKRILGMIHLSGDESNRFDRALRELMIYEDEGLYGCIIENYHGSLEDVETFLVMIENRINKIKIGINILPNEYKVAFDLANKYSVDFIQLDFISGEYESPYKGLCLKIDEKKYIKAFSNLKDGVKILGGVWPKYYTPYKGSVLKDAIIDGLFFSDAIVVTGEGTGKETPLSKIVLFREHIQSSKKFCKTPLIVGAGVDASNVVEQLQYADGAIVGSCFKPHKRTQELVSRELVKEFMNEVKKIKI